jgi:arginase
LASLTPDQVVLVGARSLDPAEAALISESSMEHVTVEALHLDPESASRAAPPGSRAYIHLDLDVTDPCQFPAVSCPTEGGVRIEVLTAALAAIRESHDIVGIGITEYAPPVPHIWGALTLLLAALGLSSG